jgi:hypothetical protein
MKKSEAITLHLKHWEKFPVFVWEEDDELVTQVDGKVFVASNAFGLDSMLDAAGIPAPRNLYFIDEPDYERD